MPEDPSPLIDFLTACWFGVIGACVGSFLNVVAYRMPLGMSVVWKPSHCPKCQTPILARDNVPVIGWLWLRGKCRSCGAPISPRYAIVEAVMGLTFFVLAYAEVFSGGANLPGGPITETTGALANVIEPNWTLLGVYAFHCTVLSLLMCAVLIAQDHSNFKPSVGVMVFYIATVSVGFLWEPTKRLRRLESNFALEVICLALSIASLVLLNRGIRNRTEMLQIAPIAMLVALSFLGPNAMPTLLLLLVVLSAAIYYTPILRVTLKGRFAMSACFIAALLQIVYWKQLHELIVS